MERMFAELAPSSPDEALYFGLCRNAFAGEASLCEDRRTKASRYFAAAVEMGRRMTAGAPSPAWGEWTLLWSLENRQAATATNELPPDWAMVQPVNRAFVQYASAIRLGNRGEGHAAAEAVTDGDRILASMPWYFHIARRLLAEAAIEDGWGTPADWLRDAEAFFDRHGYAAVASACRSLLRKCGAPLATPRARSSVPGPFASLGVSEREVEVLTALAEGLSNKEIAARLYVSPA
jgi:hypothetical protein